MRSLSKILRASRITMEDQNMVNIVVPKLATLEIQRENEEKIQKEIFEQELRQKTPDQVLHEASTEAEGMIKRAEEEAFALLQEAKNTAELNRQEIFEAAKSEGYTTGYKEGYGIGANEAEQIKAEAQQVLDQAVTEKRETLEGIEAEAVELIIKLTDKILQDTYKLNPQLILSLVRHGLSNSKVAGDVKIHISPDDYDMVLKSKQEILSMTDGTVDVEIIKDFSLNASDCIVETPFGDIDSSLEQQFKNLKQNLYYILENR